MLRLLFTLAVAAWFGSALCVTFVVAPVAHRDFPAAEARRFLRPVFPRAHRLGLGCASLALTALVLGRAGLPEAALARLAVPVTFAFAAELVSGEWLLPRLREMSAADPRYAGLHQVVVMLNMATLGALVLALAGAVLR